MMLTFDADHARKLLEISRASTARRPNFAQLMDPELWRDDMDAERKAKAMKEVETEGYTSEIKPDDIDTAKIGPGLFLVGDQGVYLMANVDNVEAKATGVDHVAYANEVDPTTMPVDTWYENKRRIFGGDDGVEFIDAETLEKALAFGVTKLEIDMTPNSMTILAPKGPSETPEP